MQLLASSGVEPRPTVLWSMTYEQCGNLEAPPQPLSSKVIRFENPALGSTYDESILEKVKDAWQTITGDDPSTFLQFQDRNEADGDVDET